MVPLNCFLIQIISIFVLGSNQNRSVPDIELHYRRGNSDDRVCVISGPSGCMESPNLCKRRVSSHQFGAHHVHHLRHQVPAHHRSGSMMSGVSGSTSSRPRICEHQPFSFSLSRATSRESVRSFVHQPGSYESNSSHYEKVMWQGGGNHLIVAHQSLLPREYSIVEFNCIKEILNGNQITGNLSNILRLEVNCSLF